MFYCTDCGAILDEKNELAEYKERGEFWGSEFTTISRICPKCKSSAIIELTKKCDYCGDYIIGIYITVADGKLYCENCYTKGDINEEYNY